MKYLINNSISKAQIIINISLFLILFCQIAYSQIIDIAATQVNVPSSGITLHPNRSFIPSAVFRNAGAIQQVLVPVRFEIMNISGSVVCLSDRTISSIDQTVDSIITFDQVEAGLSSGTYTFRVSQLLSSDTNPLNDRIVGEFFINWDSTASMIVQRRGHTANLLTNGRVLVSGGDRLTWIYNSCELYDPNINGGFGAWNAAASMSAGRTQHTATTLPDGKILATGGVNDIFQKERSCEIFDPSGNGGSGIWNITDSMAKGRAQHTAALLTNGKVLVTGGLSSDVIIATCELFDTAGNGGKGKWTTVASMNIPRSLHTATLLPDGKILVAGGHDTSHRPVSSCEIFDPSANSGLGSWTLTDSMSFARRSHNAVLLANGKVLVIGGGSWMSEIFDPSGGGSWSRSGTMKDGRLFPAATLLSNGKVLVTGGGSNSCEIFDPNASGGIGDWAVAPSMINSRSSHTSTLLLNGKLLVAGGDTGEGSMNECELFDTTESRIVRPPTRLAITSLIPETPIVNHEFKVIIESQDNNGQPQNVNLSTSIHISLAAGNGTLGGTVHGTIPAGENRIVISGATYGIAEEGVQIRIEANTGMALLPDTSGPFIVLDVPEQVVLLTPLNGATITIDSVQLVWQKTYKAVTRYRFEISNDSLFSNSISDSSVVDTVKINYALSDNSAYWWRIKAANLAGWGPFSAKWKFKTNIPPAQPQSLIADPNNMYVKLTWNENRETDLMKYYIYQGSDPDTLNIVDSTLSYNDTSIVIQNLINNQLYYFNVVAIDSSNNLSIRSSIIDAEPSLFTPMHSPGFDSLQNGSVAWGDYNNDGFLDVVMNSELDMTFQLKVYRNMHNGIFEGVHAGLTGVRTGRVKWCDYNNDNMLDILLVGSETPFPQARPGTTKLYQNSGSDQFVYIESDLRQFGNDFAYGDYDNDGQIDVIVSGWNGSSGITKLYHNDGDGIFSQTNIVFPPTQNASFSWIDYDKDNDKDLLMMAGGGSWFAKLFRNDGPNGDTGWVFKDIIAPFNGTNGGFTVAPWGDYDNDGDLDLVIVGWDPAAQLETVNIYRNDGRDKFVNIQASLPTIDGGPASWGDYDNDGILDLAFSKTIFHNEGSGIFASVDVDLQPGTSKIEWGDYDNDRDLDLIASRPVALGSIGHFIYRNNFNLPNIAPNAPTVLFSTVSGSSVYLAWQKSYDNETPPEGLSYNISIGTTPSGCEIMSPMSNLNTGLRRVVQLGNVDQDTAWVIRNLIPGKYYWTVQAIDHSYAGSEFAPVDSFVVTGTGVQLISPTVPTKFTLDQNYPNPWNPSTTIRYGLPKRTMVNLSVFNILGQKISQVVNNYQNAGSHEIILMNDGLASGVYIYRLQAGDFIATRKFLLLK